MSKDISGFKFEEKLDTKVGRVANLDGFIKTNDKYIYVEAKRREIYGASHVNQKIKVVYKDVYDYIKYKKNLRFDYKTRACIDKDKKEYFKCTFKIDGKPVEFFDLKQLICHFLGIAYELAKHSINADVKFLYLIYNPKNVKEKIDENYKKKISTRFDCVVEFINKNNDTIKNIFQAVLEYQSEIHKFKKPEVKFEFKLVDQDSYKDD